MKEKLAHIIYLVHNQNDSYIQGKKYTLAFFTIKCQKIRPSTLIRELSIQRFCVQSSTQPKKPLKCTLSLTKLALKTETNQRETRERSLGHFSALLLLLTHLIISFYIIQEFQMVVKLVMAVQSQLGGSYITVMVVRN